MLKVKPEERDLDLVITGGEYGTGKRSGWISSFILSCRGKKPKEFLEIGVCISWRIQFYFVENGLCEGV